MTEQRRQAAPAGRGGLKSFLPLCAAGIALNFAGIALSMALRLPIYFDTVGTVLSAALGGYLSGILVGFATNLIRGLWDASQMYYGVVNMIVAMCAAFFAKKGFFKTLPRALAAIPPITLVAGVLGACLTWFLNDSNIGGQFTRFAMHVHEHAGIGRFLAQLTADLLHELADKSVTILLVYLFLKLLSGRLQNGFRWNARWQAPLSEEMETAINRQTGRGVPLRTRVLLMLAAGMVCITVTAVLISHSLYKESAVEEHVKMAKGITNLIAETMDAGRTEEFIEKGHAARGYDEIERTLYKLRESYPDVKFLYVYKIMEDGCHVVFDLDAPGVEASEPGDVLEFDEAFSDELPALLRGEPIEPITSNETFGWLLTVYTPVRDHNGVTRCYAAVDFSMNMISIYSEIFIAKLVSLLLSVFIMVLALALTLAESDVILPVKSMAYCAGAFAYDSEEAREGNVQQLRELDIRTGDEIENLYHAFLKTTEDSMNYVDNLLHARLQVAEMKEQVTAMDELAHKDALTGLKNKAAYDQFTARLDGEIFEGRAAFGIAMIDLNFLKRVNDTYGHEHGNDYIRSCCEMVCTIFEHSPVFRVGGDEFVVILEKSDLAEREKLVNWFKYEIKKKAENETLKPWEKVSAAVGVAVYDPAVDQSADDVFKRADQAMYADKQAMKAVRTD